jgi:hypothetical protein
MKKKRLTLNKLLKQNPCEKKEPFISIDQDAVFDMLFSKISPLAIKLLYVACAKLEDEKDEDGEDILIRYDELNLIGFSKITLAKRNLLVNLRELSENYFERSVKDGDEDYDEFIGFLRNYSKLDYTNRRFHVSINKELLPIFLKIKNIAKTNFKISELRYMTTKSDIKFYEIFATALEGRESVEFYLDIEQIKEYSYPKKGEKNFNIISRLNFTVEKINKKTSIDIQLEKSFEQKGKKRRVSAINFKLKRKKSL